MSRSNSAVALIIPFVVTLAGCAAAPDDASGDRASATPTPSWNKDYVAGSRIPRTLDAQGQPQAGSHIVTISDQELQNSAGVLLGDKLSGGYSR